MTEAGLPSGKSVSATTVSGTDDERFADGIEFVESGTIVLGSAVVSIKV